VPLGPSTIGFWPSRALDPTAYPSGGAGMTGTAPDFARFAETIRTGGGAILKPTTVALMLRDHVGPQAQSQGPGWGWGYGWSVLVDPVAARSPMARGTIQWSGAYGNNWFVDPVNKITVVAFTNTAIEGMTGKFTTDLRDAVYAGLGASQASAAAARLDERNRSLRKSTD
jgi:CubicO group peptidase (beta-lactamase class C family)